MAQQLEKARKGGANIYSRNVKTVFHFQYPPLFFPPLGNSASVDVQRR
jgi:hypothetical protein